MTVQPHHQATQCRYFSISCLKCKKSLCGLGEQEFTLPCAAPGLAVFGEGLAVLLSVLLQGCSIPPDREQQGTTPELFVCPVLLPWLLPAGFIPTLPLLEPVVHSDPYQHVITVVKVSINRISSCPNLLASSAVLFLTKSMLMLSRNIYIFLNLSIKHKKMLCLNKNERCPLDIFKASKNTLKSVTKLIEQESCGQQFFHGKDHVSSCSWLGAARRRRWNKDL